MARLQPLSPEEAKNRYLNSRNDLSVQSRQEHGYRIDRFLAFANDQGLTNMNDLTGRFVDDYAQHRQKSVAAITVKGEIDTLRLLIRKCEEIEACPPGIADRISTPHVVEGDDVREDRLYPEAAQAILDKLERFEYAGRQHVILLLLWRTGIRRGTLRGFDLCDFETEGSNYVLNTVHRPKTGTPLKNKEKGERPIVLKPRTGRVVKDYIDVNRKAVCDENGREPLLTTTHGRVSVSALQRTVYKLTRPCKFGRECPIGRDPAECEAVKEHHRASTCPESVATHAVRRGHMSFYRSKGVPAEKLSERVNASPDTIKKHYDQRTKAEKIDAQRTWMDEVDDGF